MLEAKVLGDMSAAMILMPSWEMLWLQTWLLLAVPRESVVYLELMVPTPGVYDETVGHRT